MKINFTKMHGAGNDYVYVNCFREKVDDPGELSILLSDRHKGIGGDGLVLICPSDKADAQMRMFNLDGSEGAMCGNAIRCVAKFIYDNGIAHKDTVTIETKSGIKTIQIRNKNDRFISASVDMGKAVFVPAEIPMSCGGDSFVSKPITVGGKDYLCTAVSMGNPHAVIFTDGIDSLDLEKTGPQFENHKLFPNRINTEFIEVIDAHTLNMRVWERGSGETFACGTGACASAVAAVLNGFCARDEEILIHLRGGDLRITYKSDETVIMKGPAEFICEGTIEDEYINMSKENVVCRS